MVGPVKSIVITQPMYFPWVGLLEQIKHADTIVFYNDVQFSKGSFVNRVQLKMPTKSQWLTVPLKKFKLGTSINQIEMSNHIDWKEEHKRLLAESLGAAPFYEDASKILDELHIKSDLKTVNEVAKQSMMSLVDYFGLSSGKLFIDIEDLNIHGSGSQRVLDVVTALGGTRYITGHGAAKYLAHEAFEHSGIEVHYLDYQCQVYPQLHGSFVPYVTSLDLVANMGMKGNDYICSQTKYWREFLHERK